MSSILARSSARPGMTIASNQMLKIANPFDADIIRDGIRRYVEIETPTEAPEAMTDLDRGVAVNVGVVRDGSKPNVTAEEAYAEVDMCVPTIADTDEFVPRILGPQSRTDGVIVGVIGELNRQPYERGNA